MQALTQARALLLPPHFCEACSAPARGPSETEADSSESDVLHPSQMLMGPSQMGRRSSHMSFPLDSQTSRSGYRFGSWGRFERNQKWAGGQWIWWTDSRGT